MCTHVTSNNEKIDIIGTKYLCLETSSSIGISLNKSQKYPYENNMNNMMVEKKDALSEFLKINKDMVKNKHEDIDTKRNKEKISIFFMPSPRFEA